ncbi:MAG TPA: DAHL domain-containing protein, partial [Polyangiaceae bacterium]|nr:DAHL domain-containing protein [Polyangiaceae bacterium]
MTARIRPWAATVALVGSAALVSVVLYDRTRVSDIGDRTAVTSSIRELQRWSAQVSRETLATRYGLVPYYDSLTLADKRQFDTSRRLAMELGEVGRTRPAVETGVSTVLRSVAARREDIEHFKSENAILRNSLYYLPLAARELEQRLEREPGARRDALVRAIDEVVEATLVFNLIRSDAGREQNAASLGALEALAPSIPEPLRPDFDLFVRHARTVLRQHDVVNPLTSRILGSPLDAEVGLLERTYLAEAESSLARAERYRGALYGWSIVVLLAFIGAAYKLRSVYANLERLVKERTRKLDQALSELWGEMELARRIQTALVPSTPSLEGCDVAAAMRPA